MLKLIRVYRVAKRAAGTAKLALEITTRVNQYSGLGNGYVVDEQPQMAIRFLTPRYFLFFTVHFYIVVRNRVTLYSTSSCLGFKQYAREKPRYQSIA